MQIGFVVQLRSVSTIAIVTMTVGLVGCGSAPSMPSADRDSSSTTAPSESPSASAVPATELSEPMPVLPTISLGGEAASTPASDAQLGERQRRRELIEAMDPLQVMLGSWKGTTQREFGDFKALDEPEWVWDFQADPDQPAMVMTSDASPYFQQLRLTYLTDTERFRLMMTDPDGVTRTFVGNFSQPVEEFQGDDERRHRRYKLELTEVEPVDEKDAWQVVFNQQENNRYLVELSRKHGPRFMRFDTVATQRQGTSIALNDAGYGEKACIITGGLGTSTVSHNGKTYWVCCSGCRAAFEDDPEKWIAAAVDLKSNE